MASPALPLRIFVRSNTDWDRMAPASFAAQSDEKLPLLYIRGAAQRGILDIWNQAFAIDFFTYRSRVQRIARESFDAVHADAVTFGFDDFSRWYESDDDEIIAPIDDDDFYSPRLREIARAFEPGTDIVIWMFTRVGFLDHSPTRSCQFMSAPFLAPNNWAIRKSFLRRTFTPDEAKQVLAHHAKANAMVARKLSMPEWTPKSFGLTLLFHPSVRLLDGGFYSMYNGHPGSIAFLVDLLSNPADGVAKLAHFDLSSRAFLDQMYRDSEPYVRALESVLTPRGSIP